MCTDNYFKIYFQLDPITEKPVTNNGLTKMATGSDDSEFAEFNSSKVRKEFKERQEKLKRKEISSRKFGRMMVFDIVGDLKTERCKNELMKLRCHRKSKLFPDECPRNTRHKASTESGRICAGRKFVPLHPVGSVINRF